MISLIVRIINVFRTVSLTQKIHIQRVFNALELVENKYVCSRFNHHVINFNK